MVSRIKCHATFQDVMDQPPSLGLRQSGLFGPDADSESNVDRGGARPELVLLFNSDTEDEEKPTMFVGRLGR